MKSKIINLFENFINNLTNEPNPKVLYHFTKSEAAYSILKTNTLKGMDNLQVSFTSDASYYGNGFQPEERTRCMFAFDADKLSKDYTIERYVYNKDDTAKFNDYINEHEWIIKNQVNNISKYLLYISSVKDKMNQEDLDRIKKDFPNVKIDKW